MEVEALDNLLHYGEDDEYDVEQEAPNFEGQGISRKFTWKVENFRFNMAGPLISNHFYGGGIKWKMCLCPMPKMGSDYEDIDYYSLYINVDLDDDNPLPHGWKRFAHYSLTIVDQNNISFSIKKERKHYFDARYHYCHGFNRFVSARELLNPNRGYIKNDACIMEANISVKEFGYVGLESQRDRCYLNCMIQTLYHIPFFRKAVYKLPLAGGILGALQSLFYKLQHFDHSNISTNSLIKSFGWDKCDSFSQRDVQEFITFLCENIEKKIKDIIVLDRGGPFRVPIQKLFEGHCMNYKTTRKESYYDIQLDVKGCKDVYDSFDKYVELEQFPTEQDGLQEARIGKLFIDFPPILQLSLKRFEHDSMKGSTVKINDRYEFPLQLDLDRGNGKYLSSEADRSVRNLYTLFSVLGHSSGAGSGHYYAYIRPDLSDQWFKFDDERVTKEDAENALEEQYGGEEESPQTKCSNAYILVYIRDSDKDQHVFGLKEDDIFDQLRASLKEEQEEKEKRRKEKEEAYTIVKVAWKKHLEEHIGNYILFDLVDHSKVHSIRVHKQMSFAHFKEKVAQDSKGNVEVQRFWLWTKSENLTFRPTRPLKLQEETQPIGQLLDKANGAELMLYMDLETGQDSLPQQFENMEEELLLFFKHYDPCDEKLRYVGRLCVPATGKPKEIVLKLNEMAQFAADEEIVLFKEIKLLGNVMCGRIDKNSTYLENQLESGDIIWYRMAHYGNGEPFRYQDVPHFMEKEGSSVQPKDLVI